MGIPGFPTFDEDAVMKGLTRGALGVVVVVAILIAMSAGFPWSERFF
jgi:hypothetical protein